MVSDEQVRKVGRRLRDLVEPIAANVYFAPEAQERYKGIGIDDYGAGYFTSRGACMGRVPGEMVVAAFGVFEPDLVVRSVDAGWQATDPPTVLDARREGANAALTRILGGAPDGAIRATELLRRTADAGTGEGRPLFSGLRSLEWPGDEVAALWRAADLVREHRGDSHTCAWVSSGVDATEITLLTELWWRIRLGSYVRTRGWSDDDIAAALARLRERGLVAADDDAFTNEGEALRAGVEEATDRGERRLVEALGDDADELFSLLAPWSAAVVESGGYPRDPSKLTRP